MQLTTNNNIALDPTIMDTHPTAKTAREVLPAAAATPETGGFMYTSAAEGKSPAQQLLDKNPVMVALRNKAEKDIQAVRALVSKPGPLNLTAVNSALKTAFEDVKVYGMVGMWTLTDAEMRNISGTTEVQQATEDQEQAVEQLSVKWSTYYTTVVLHNDEAFVLYEANDAHFDNSQDRATAVSVASSIYTEDSSTAQVFTTQYNSENNNLSNTVSTEGQNIQTAATTVQQTTIKLLDTLTQILGSI